MTGVSTIAENCTCTFLRLLDCTEGVKIKIKCKENRTGSPWYVQLCFSQIFKLVRLIDILCIALIHVLHNRMDQSLITIVADTVK